MAPGHSACLNGMQDLTLIAILGAEELGSALIVDRRTGGRTDGRTQM